MKEERIFCMNWNLRIIVRNRALPDDGLIRKVYTNYYSYIHRYYSFIEKSIGDLFDPNYRVEKFLQEKIVTDFELLLRGRDGLGLLESSQTRFVFLRNGGIPNRYDYDKTLNFKTQLLPNLSKLALSYLKTYIATIFASWNTYTIHNEKSGSTEQGDGNRNY